MLLPLQTRISITGFGHHLARRFPSQSRYDAKYHWMNLLGEKVVLLGISLYLMDYSCPKLVKSSQMEVVACLSGSFLQIEQVNAGVIALRAIDIEDGSKRSRVAVDFQCLQCGFLRRLSIDLLSTSQYRYS